MHDQPHPGAREAVGGCEPAPTRRRVGEPAQHDEFGHHFADPHLGECVVPEHAIACGPVGEVSVGLPMRSRQLFDALAVGRGKLVGSATSEMQIHGAPWVGPRAISSDTATASASPMGMVLDACAMVSVLTMRTRPADCNRA